MSVADYPAYDARAAVRSMWRKRAGTTAGLALFFCIPLLWFLNNEASAYNLAWAFCAAMVGLSMNVLVGYAGQISLAQAVLFGTGAFAVGHYVSTGMPWILAVILSGLTTGAVALAIGFPALRIRGLNLAIATLGFQFVMQRTIFRTEWLSGGAGGVNINRPTLFGLSTDAHTDYRNFLYVVMIFFILIWFLDRNLTRSRGGRALFALRQDEQVAASFGIPVARYKLMAFVISGFYAGVAGALFGTLIGNVTNENFDFNFTIEFLVFAVLGGLGSRAGTAFGGGFPTIFRRYFENLRFTGQMIAGSLLVFTLLRYPGGIAQQGREARHVTVTLWRRKAIYGLAFVGAAIGSAALAIGVGIAVRSWIMAYVIKVPPLSHFMHAAPILPSIVIGLILFAGGVDIAGKRLMRLAGTTEKTAIEHVEELEEEIHPEVAITKAPSLTFRRENTSTYKGPLLSVENVAIRFGGVRALDGVSLEVREGELIGIMGPNGSGKTTLLNNISGFLKPNEGDIKFRGESLLGVPPHKRAALGLGRTFQNVGLVKQETVLDNFVIAQHLVCQYGALEGLMRTGGVVNEERRLRARANAAIELLGLGDIQTEVVRSLPHGRAKLVELGCALVTGPELLLLDEPAAGVSPQEADALGEALKNIAAEFGVTILMIEHHVPLMLQTCDYIYVLNFGQMLTHGEPQEVARHPDVIAAYLGTSGSEAGRAAVAASH